MKKQIVLLNETLHRFHYYQYLYGVKNKAFEKYVKNKERLTKYNTLPKNIKEIYDVLLTNVEIKKLLFFSKYMIAGKNVHKFDELRDFYTNVFFWKHNFFIYLKILYFCYPEYFEQFCKEYWMLIILYKKCIDWSLKVHQEVLENSENSKFVAMYNLYMQDYAILNEISEKTMNILWIYRLDRLFNFFENKMYGHVKYQWHYLFDTFYSQTQDGNRILKYDYDFEVNTDTLRDKLFNNLKQDSSDNVFSRLIKVINYATITKEKFEIIKWFVEEYRNTFLEEITKVFKAWKKWSKDWYFYERFYLEILSEVSFYTWQQWLDKKRKELTKILFDLMNEWFENYERESTTKNWKLDTKKQESFQTKMHAFKCSLSCFSLWTLKFWSLHFWELLSRYSFWNSQHQYQSIKYDENYLIKDFDQYDSVFFDWKSYKKNTLWFFYLLEYNFLNIRKWLILREDSMKYWLENQIELLDLILKNKNTYTETVKFMLKILKKYEWIEYFDAVKYDNVICYNLFLKYIQEYKILYKNKELDQWLVDEIKNKFLEIFELIEKIQNKYKTNF